MNLELLVSENNNNKVIPYLSLCELRVIEEVNLIPVHNNIATYLEFDKRIKEYINRLLVCSLLPRDIFQEFILF